MKQSWKTGVVLAALAGGLVWSNWPVQGEDPAKVDPALERARTQVRMLDDLYKNAVVAITDKYVKKETDLPAASIAMQLFEAMKKNGWHESRLIDATGQPYEDKNVAKDDFEKSAVAALKSGKSYYEQVVTVNGERRLRAATSVPVVMKQCLMCHENYADVKEGAPAGVLTYNVPVK